MLSGSANDLTWGDDEGRAKCVRAILQHRSGGAEPPSQDVKLVVLELAYHWRDGHPWILGDSQLARLGL